MLNGIEAIIWDFDGVLNAKPEPAGWTDHLKEHWDIDPRTFRYTVFNAEFLSEVVTGKRDLYEHLRLTNEGFYPDDKVEDFGAWWFDISIELDPQMIEFCTGLAKAGYASHLGTNNEPHRARHIWEHHGMKNHMGELFTSGHMGARKPHSEYFRQIEDRLGLPASALILVDDYIGNVEGARACGWKAHHYEGIEGLKAELGYS